MFEKIKKIFSFNKKQVSGGFVSPLKSNIELEKEAMVRIEQEFKKGTVCYRRIVLYGGYEAGYKQCTILQLLKIEGGSIFYLVKDTDGTIHKASTSDLIVKK